MRKKTIKDYSDSRKTRALKFDAENELYQTCFSDWVHLGSYYKSENYICHTDGKRNSPEKISHTVKRHAIMNKWILSRKFHHKSELSVVDIGCETGDF